MEQTGTAYPKFYLYSRLVKAKLFIDNNYQENIGVLENIADEAYFSKFHFIRLFKTIYGKTPHQYLIKVRIEKAKLFLGMNHHVTETCFMIGFDSITSFTGLFKKSEGKTPSEYQRQYRIRQEKISQHLCTLSQTVLLKKKGGRRIAIFKRLYKNTLRTFASLFNNKTLLQ